jgi:hypothetical protein
METGQPQVVKAGSKEQAELDTLKEIKDLFASAHDLIAQAQYPGHAYQKIGSVLAFLKFQYNDFVGRVERHEKAIANVVDVEAAKAATDAVLSTGPAEEAPKA